MENLSMRLRNHPCITVYLIGVKKIPNDNLSLASKLLHDTYLLQHKHRVQ